MNFLQYIFNSVIDPKIIVGIIGGIIVSFVTKFGNSWIKEFFDNRKRKKNLKLKAAGEINLICNEGMHKSFRIRAESEQKYKLTALNIESVDEAVGLKLRKFLDNWIQCRNCLKRNPCTVDDERMAKEYRDEAQKLGDELIVIAKKWGK